MKSNFKECEGREEEGLAKFGGEKEKNEPRLDGWVDLFYFSQSLLSTCKFLIHITLKTGHACPDNVNEEEGD